MPRTSRPLSTVLVVALAAAALGACGDRASAGQAQAERSAAGAGHRSAPSACPSVEQVGQAAGFPVTLAQVLGTNPDTWMACQYEMTGRYRGTFIIVTGEPASGADSIYAEMKQRVKALNGQDAEADRLDLGRGGLALGSDSHGEAAAVVGPHVYHVELGHAGVGSIGDQKDAMIRVLKLVAH